MRNKSLKYIFGILLSSVLLTVGCGSSSSNNPVSNGSVNSGLVSVSGNVKNANGNGTVSFYTPTAIYGNNMTNGISRAVVNNEIYTFNIDEKGNYAGQIPAGDYYIIAQNSDGSMKYASARKSISLESTFSEDNISSSESVDIPEIELVPTITIEGTLSPTDSSLTNVGQYVYIENMPFVTETESNGYFKLESVPTSSSYTICSDIWVENTRNHFSYTTTEVQVTSAATTKKISEISLSHYQPISISGKNIKILVVDDSNEPFKDGYKVRALITSNNDIFATETDENGEILLPVNSKDDITGFYINGKVISSSEIKEVDGKLTITIPQE